MKKKLTHSFRKWLSCAILCHHLWKWSFFGPFLTTHFSEPRNASTNPISPAVRMTLELFEHEKNLTHSFRNWLSCAILCHHLWKWSFLALFRPLISRNPETPAQIAFHQLLEWRVNYLRMKKKLNPQLPEVALMRHFMSLSNPFFSKLRWAWKRVIIAINIFYGCMKIPKYFKFHKKITF